MYKPRGVTAAAVVQEVKGVLSSDVVSGGVSQRVKSRLKVGHGGTLDREAEGVLVIGVGQDCKRLGRYLRGGKKTYAAQGRFGTATDTYDASGNTVVSRSCAHVTRSAVEACLMDHFTGEVMQSPPTYSALKIGGQRLSDLARVGLPVARPQPRPVTILSATLEHFALPNFTLSVTCKSGTYIRSLIHDLGVAMATCAHMTALQRTRDGPFGLEHCLPQKDWTVAKIKLAANEVEETPVQPQCMNYVLSRQEVTQQQLGEFCVAPSWV